MHAQTRCRQSQQTEGGRIGSSLVKACAQRQANKAKLDSPFLFWTRSVVARRPWGVYERAFVSSVYIWYVGACVRARVRAIMYVPERQYQ